MTSGIRGAMAELYDVFVDWPGRLGRELPGIERHLTAVGARRVLDVGCGTGRHVRALLERGYDALGADVSEDMLQKARAWVGAPERVVEWRLGATEPRALAAGAFDALLALGNTWPQVVSEEDARAAAAAFQRLLRPGGLLLLGLKAVALRVESGDPYLPLLRRMHEGRPLWFVRFVDFDVTPAPDGVRACDLHMAILAGGADAAQALHHGAGRMRVWSAEELASWFAARGFVDVRVSGRLDDPNVPPATEDVFLSARHHPLA